MEIRRSKGVDAPVHARLPGALAELQSGFVLWLEYALETGAIDAAEKTELEQRCMQAFQELAVLQTRYQQAGDPAMRFLGLLKAALACGHGHIADRTGNAPESAEIWGWKRHATGSELAPQGSRIGWVKGGDLFLEPTASYRVAQAVAGSQRLTLSQQALHHRLQESGLLVSVDSGRQMVQVRRTMEGKPRQVLHLKANELAAELEKAPKS